MSKHTPGPWAVGPDIIGAVSDGKFTRHIVSKIRGTKRRPLKVPADQVAADFRLIAAAPGLLEVAQGALTVLRRLAHDGKHDMVCIEARDGAMVNVLGLMNDLRAAIAKAEGGVQ